MVASIGASNPFAALTASNPFARDQSRADKPQGPSVTDEIGQAGGFYEWQKKVKREKLEEMIRKQVETEFAAQGGGDPQALKSAIAEEIAKRLREAIEQEAKADAQSGDAKGAIIDIAV
ncbi:hypothetical protein [Phenylobacterium sp.]|uniref:hypothetical protein n=1 Tax=Phenylobacterium sp. TaxID=1871053 RepID=UPI00272F717A|nr:hypothetical protein [Phenylobacterium sp.]MDP1617655.1 hypothetical protein [Phenylobacterium sp.]MDP1985872.1 hypothetical protein [Phenylobacterium sp.]